MILLAESLTKQTPQGEITEDGKIHGIEKATPNEFKLADNPQIIMPYAAPGVTSGNRGNKSNNFCCADHVHAYSDAWKNDNDFQVLFQKYDTAKNLINESNAIKGLSFAQKMLNDITSFSAVFAALITGSAPFLASFAVLMIKILEIMTGFNLDFEIDIDGIMRTSEWILDMLKQIYG